MRAAVAEAGQHISWAAHRAAARHGWLGHHVYLPRHGRHQAAVLLAAIGAHTNRSLAMSNRVFDAATWILKTAFDWRPSTACRQSTPFGNTSRTVDCCLMEQRGLVLSAQRALTVVER